MSFFTVSIESVQHVKALSLEIDVQNDRLFCIVGRNGAGKTTLIRALRNLSSADTFLRTANSHIFNNASKIEYSLGAELVSFKYDKHLRTINCRTSISPSLRNLVSAELPIPYGERFSYHRSASDADGEIRKALVLGNHRAPTELIEFLSAVYATDRFNDLVEISVKNRSFYCVPLSDSRYIREDYLSSGEYFLINLYRTIRGPGRLIAVDEIEISLDAVAQTRLADWLRHFCKKYSRSILFTTHSLALLQTLRPSEILYLESVDGNVSCQSASFSYVKARLFGFRGWDRYILTEDIELAEFIEFVIQQRCSHSFFTHKIIHIGGAPQVVDLLRRNAVEGFLAEGDHVVAVLDGDQRGGAFDSMTNVIFAPIESVEKAAHAHHSELDFPYKFSVPRTFTGPKDLYRALLHQKIATSRQIYEYLCERYATEVDAFSRTLAEFLGTVVTASPATRR